MSAHLATLSHVIYDSFDFVWITCMLCVFALARHSYRHRQQQRLRQRVVVVICRYRCRIIVLFSFIAFSSCAFTEKSLTCTHKTTENFGNVHNLCSCSFYYYSFVRSNQYQSKNVFCQKKNEAKRNEMKKTQTNKYVRIFVYSFVFGCFVRRFFSSLLLSMLFFFTCLAFGFLVYNVRKTRWK